MKPQGRASEPVRHCQKWVDIPLKDHGIDVHLNYIRLQCSPLLSALPACSTLQCFPDSLRQGLSPLPQNNDQGASSSVPYQDQGGWQQN